MCETGISIVVEPDHVVYGRVREEDIDEILDAAERGEVVDHLIVARPLR